MFSLFLVLNLSKHFLLLKNSGNCYGYLNETSGKSRTCVPKPYIMLWRWFVNLLVFDKVQSFLEFSEKYNAKGWLCSRTASFFKHFLCYLRQFVSSALKRNEVSRFVWFHVIVCMKKLCLNLKLVCFYSVKEAALRLFFKNVSMFLNRQHWSSWSQ